MQAEAAGSVDPVTPIGIDSGDLDTRRAVVVRQRGYEVLGLVLLGLLMIAPAAAANTPPVCADVTATVQNVAADYYVNGGGRPVDHHRGRMQRP